MTVRTWSVVVLAGFWVAAASAGDTWVGKTAVPLRAEVAGRSKPDPAAPALPVTGPVVVVEEAGEWARARSAVPGPMLALTAESLRIGPGPRPGFGPDESWWVLKSDLLAVEEARTTFAARVKSHPADEDAIVSLARFRHYVDDDPDAALAVLDTARRALPKSTHVLREGASVMFHCGAYTGAIATLTECLRFEPGDREALSCRGAAWLRQGDPDRAAADFMRAVELNPGDWQNRGALAMVCLNREDYAAARKVLDEAIVRCPGVAELHRCRGLVRNEQKDAAGAIQDFDAAMKLDPGRAAVAVFHRGQARQRTGDAKAGLADMDRAIEDGFRHPWAFQERGLARLAAGQLDGAIADFDEAVRRDRRWTNLVAPVRAQADLARADRAVKANPKDVAALLERAGAHVGTGNVEAGLADCDAAAKLDPKRAAVYYQRGKARWAGDEVEGAVRDLTEAARLDPANREYVHDRIAALAKMNPSPDGIATALKAADHQVRVDPNAVAFAIRATIRIKAQDFDGSLSDWAEAVRLDPTLASAWSGRGTVYLAKGELEKAVADLKRAAELSPEDPGAWTHLANACHDRKAWANALRAAHRGQSAATLAPDPKATLMVAWLLAVCPRAEFRDGPRAVRLARDACEHNKWAVPSDRCVLAVAYAEAGNFEEAVFWQQMTLHEPDLDPKVRADRERRLELFREKKPYREE